MIPLSKKKSTWCPCHFVQASPTPLSTQLASLIDFQSLDLCYNFNQDDLDLTRVLPFRFGPGEKRIGRKHVLGVAKVGVRTRDARQGEHHNSYQNQPKTGQGEMRNLVCIECEKLQIKDLVTLLFHISYPTGV